MVLLVLFQGALQKRKSKKLSRRKSNKKKPEKWRRMAHFEKSKMLDSKKAEIWADEKELEL